ncbi:uncharacterized protein LOC117110805 [Anneissia japonica]|uniref:uncharacterized protein LOC117110805 n=1 Tax=Anneissia japonica TaxID=1529436 RepID=UPI0014258373|nr:uncharacterized protein LOC117110805 [Anneissia japonica]XP_033109519.1 uncharacterized protein LOC117110805 [Anneissia japonica]
MKRVVVCQSVASNMTPRNSMRFRLQQETVKVLEEFKTKCVQFAAKNIFHHHLRLEYLNLAAEICRLINQHVDRCISQYPSRSSDIWRDALEEARKLKNEMSEYLKGMTSSFGKTISKMLQSNGGNYPMLIQSYSRRLFRANFIELNVSQQERIFIEILRQTSRTNLVIVSIRRWCGKLGIMFVIVTIGILMYNISVAINPTYNHISRAVSLGFGASSGCVGRELGAEISACGGPVGVFLGGFIGGLNVAFVNSLGNEGLLRILTRLLFPASTSEFHMPLTLKGYHDIYGAPKIRTSNTSRTTSQVSLPSRPPRCRSAPIRVDCTVTKHSVRKLQRCRSRSATPRTSHGSLPNLNVPKYEPTIPPSTSLFMPDGYPAFPRGFSYW